MDPSASGVLVGAASALACGVACASARPPSERQIEAEIMGLPGFEDYCYRPAGRDGPCERPLSATRLFFGAYDVESANTSALLLRRVATRRLG